MKTLVCSKNLCKNIDIRGKKIKIIESCSLRKEIKSMWREIAESFRRRIEVYCEKIRKENAE